MKNLQPISNNILVRPTEELTNGLVILDSASHLAHMGKPLKGVVVSTGPGYYTKKGVRIPPDFKDGDTVIYLNHDIYNKIKYNNEDVIVIRSNQIVAVVDCER